MQSENHRPLLAVACRFGASLSCLELSRNADHEPLYYRTVITPVPYDQWFITHLDDKQKVKQVKHWILSKCNIIQTPHLPAQRPVSPITFATSVRTRSSVDSMEDGYNEDDEYDEDSDDLDDFSFRHPELRRQTIYARRPGKSSSSTVPVSSSHNVQPGSSPVTDQYTLISFSTGAILEDDYALSWYNLRPFELLEMHRAGKVVQLPREALSEYVQPYFEAKVRALRAIWSPKSGRFESPANHKTNRDSYSPRSRDKMIVPPLQPEKKKRKAKVEWKDRWIVINQGTLSLCKDSTGGTPVHHFPLTSLRALRGAESLARACSIIAEQRVVCLKFSKEPKVSPLVASSSSLPSSPIADDWKTDIYIEPKDINPLSEKPPPALKETSDNRDHNKHSPASDYNPEDICRGEGEWLVLDLLDDHAFSNILRILHRYTSHPISSSFLPSSSIITVANYWNNVSSPALTPFVYSSPYDSLPYPEWRTNTIETARKAGMGDVGKPLALILWSERSRGDSLLHDIRNQRYAFSQGRSYKSSTSSYAPYSDSEPGDTDGESEMEWEGWMRDLERQGSVKQQHPDKSLHSPSGSEHQFPSPPISSSSPPSPPLSDASSRGHSPPHSPSAYPTIDKVIQNGDAFPRPSLDSRVPSMIKTTTISTVSVGSASSPPRRRSSTVTPGGLSRLMKDKDKDRPGRDVARPSTAVANGSRTNTLPRSTHIRHALSGSNLRLAPAEHVFGSQSHRAQDAEGSSSGKKKVGIVRGMSMRAEKLVRGLDAAIDFVDNHP
ncbi:hypothetical protein AZE42_06290 [Rhizopogon vesiculosus]|uniref:Uncharacterized protein n=1 Tax=Rhizopogon vesiculosus TaxID=180088 RepID=A0A1J8QD48_9AGAM|nr:hypothetical protein AZE42_06290 [Rhizopogon vesiculosus]